MHSLADTTTMDRFVRRFDHRDTFTTCRSATTTIGKQMSRQAHCPTLRIAPAGRSTFAYTTALEHHCLSGTCVACRKAVATLIIACVIVTATFIGGCRTQTDDHQGAVKQGKDVPPLFTEIQEEVGLRFVHNPERPGTWFYPEIMISGAAMFDYDRDGDLDIYLLNCGAAMMSGVKRDPTVARNQLFRQEENGQFVDVTDQSGLGDEGYGVGVAVGDVNNDGYPDVFLTNYGQDRLFLNEGNGHFKDITSSSGISNERWSAAACFLDYDRDGWLDMYVSNYVDYFPTRKCYGASGRRDYCGPVAFDKTVDRLFRNTTGDAPPDANGSASGGVRFQDVSLAAGIAKRAGSGLGVMTCDFTDDGWPDIYVANDMVGNFLWVNQQDGTFRDEALSRGVAYDALGRPQASMGVAVGDVNEDQVPDLYVTHMAGEMNVLYVSDGVVGYREMAMRYGLSASLHPLTTFGTALLDIDHNGLEDVVVANGSMKLPDSAVEIPSFSDEQAYWQIFAEHNQVFLHNEPDVFALYQSRQDLFTSRNEVSRGVCVGDIDNDGDLDLLVVNTAAAARLYRNDSKKKGNWLRLRVLEPDLGGRDAYGARITVRVGKRKWTRWLNPGGSYLSSHDPTVHFGLGPVREIYQIEVRWPDGSCEQFTGGATNQLRVLNHGTSANR